MQKVMAEFYKHSLRDERWENYQFLLNLSQYVWQKHKVVTVAQHQLLEMYHSKFIRDIGDAVLHFVNDLRREEDYLEKRRIIVNAIHSEECSGVGKTRDDLFRLANKYILEDNYSFEFRVLNACTPPYPFTDGSKRTNSKVRHYLLPKVYLSGLDEANRVNFNEDVERSLFSPAMIKTGKFIDFCGMHLTKKKDPKACLVYLANVLTLLLEVTAFGKTDFVYHILGEAEHVMNVHKETFPGHGSLHNYSGCMKLTLA